MSEEIILFYRKLKVSHIIENPFYDYFRLEGEHRDQVYNKRIMNEITALDEFIKIIKVDTIEQLEEVKLINKREKDKLRMRAKRNKKKNEKLIAVLE
jgi:hypothetical protein